MKKNLVFSKNRIFSIIKEVVFLSFFLFLSITFPRQIFATTLSVGSCGGCYATIQEAVEVSADGDTIYVPAGTYDESVTVDHQLLFDTTDAESVVNITKLELKSSVSQSRPGTFTVESVAVRAGSSANLADAIAFVKVGGEINVDGKPSDETCLNNHWQGGITINKDLTLEVNPSESGELVEDVCLTDSEGTAITVTSGDVTIKNFILYNSVNGLKVSGGKVTVSGGAIINNTHGIVTTLGTEVDATRIYWGHGSGPYNAIHNPQGQANDVGNEVTFCPFYTDQEKANLDDALCRSSSGSNSSPSNSTAPVCNDAKPVNTPDLFQINANSTTSKLFFTPISNTNKFYISFSTKPLAEEHGTEVTLAREGVQNFTVNFLKPDTTYYFKVRGQNGCMPGDWSNIMKITTPPKGTTEAVLFYKNLFTKIDSLLTSGKKLPNTNATPTVTITPRPLPTLVPQTKTNTSSTVTPIPKKNCFLWWCF